MNRSLLLLLALSLWLIGCSSGHPELTAGNGVWVRSCAQSSKSEESLTFDGDNLFVESRSFANSNCTENTYTSAATGTYTTADPLANGATPLDWTIQDVLMTYHRQQEVDLANKWKLCGADDWRVGVSKNVTKCPVPLLDANKVFYTIFMVENDQLYFGKQDSSHKGDTPESRPVELDRDKYYTRSENNRSALPIPILPSPIFVNSELF